MDQLLELDQKCLDRLIGLVHQHTGMTMNSGKKALLQGRLRPRLKKLGLKSFDEYINYLQSSKEEIQEFVNLVTTNETQFFRTPRIWEYFQKDFLPNWCEKNPGKTLKIWSGAASSGEEIYTIAICCEDFKNKNKNFQYSIVGTDISTQVLQEAEKALYSGRSIDNFRNLYPQLFEKYMKPVGEEFKVAAEIVAKVRFSPYNLLTPAKDKQAYDIIFLRNVLIYFTGHDQEIILKNIAEGLIPQGTLIIGESESLNSLDVPFSYKSPLIYQKGKAA